jgi:hypothetical protein
MRPGVYAIRAEKVRGQRISSISGSAQSFLKYGSVGAYRRK